MQNSGQTWAKMATEVVFTDVCFFFTFFFGEPSRTSILLQDSYWLRTWYAPFSESNSENHQNVGVFSHRFFFDFPYFFGIDFRIDFFIDFWWKMVPKMDQNLLARTPLFPSFLRPFPKVDFLMHFGRPLAHLWLPFGSPWLPFGSLWLTLGSLWLTFGSLWLPVGSLLAPAGSLLAHFWRLLAHFSCLLVTFFVFLCIFDENDVQNHIFI